MARGGWDDPWRTFPKSTPIRVEGGLATRRQRGAMSDSWWSRRFVEVLDSYGLGNRLARGRSYARQGQVLSLDISPGLLTAQVQGSRRTPYVVTITVGPLTDRQWRVVDNALSSRIGLTAHLLAGEVPAELEDVFDVAKAPLFPARWRDLTARCSCPDSANPCKHIAAALYLYADRLDGDPWLLLQWRGRTQDEVLAALGLDAAASAADAELPPWWPLLPGEALPDTARHDLPVGGASADPPVPVDAVLRRMEDLDVLAWKEPVGVALRTLYAAALEDDGSAPEQPRRGR
ncbi:MAG: SWIM zinc finger family protein [Actinomycetales bacterium]|nr:SWIM zinc finger family protein [Actinomycetales bacterium]